MQETQNQTPERQETLQTIGAELFAPNVLRNGVLNAPRTRLPTRPVKVEITPVLLRNERKFQFAYHPPRKVTHRNLNAPEAQAELAALLTTQFKQAAFHTAEGSLQLTLNKRNELAVRREKEKKRKGDEEKESAIDASFLLPPSSFAHDRVKNHLLPEGEPVPFLIALGVMSEDGRVIAARRDKFRQINRFLEMVADVIESLRARARQTPEQPLRVMDFGCGKGYLTFALYHYLHNVCGLNVSLLGVDIKQDVLAHLTTLAAELNYTGLSFFVSDIRSVTLEGKKEKGQSEAAPFLTHGSPADSRQPPAAVDLVVALHACDTATDDALAKAVAWNAQVILAAPCCQHELFSKIHNPALQSMLQHGIVRERLNALVTDTLRAELLHARGYQVQMLEFVNVEHTPKNLLIRAVRRADNSNEAQNAARSQAAQETYAGLRDFWHVQPYMEQALKPAMANKIASAVEDASSEIAANERE